MKSTEARLHDLESFAFRASEDLDDMKGVLRQVAELRAEIAETREELHAKIVETRRKSHEEFTELCRSLLSSPPLS